MAQAAVAGASAPVVVARKGAARTLGTNDPNEVPVNYDGTCEGDYDGPPPAVRLACDCAHCAEADWFLRRLRAWRELEVHTYPPLERIRRQLLWRGVSHFTYLDAMRLAEMCLRALDEAEEAFQADARPGRAELAAQAARKSGASAGHGRG
jgi:hypothetical protein